MERFKAALRRYFASQDKEPVVLDHNVATQGTTHCHPQLVGVTKEKAKTAREVFEIKGAKYHVKFHDLHQEEDLEAPKDASTGLWQLLRDETNGLPFLYAEVPDGQGGSTQLLHHVEGKHYVQFGLHDAAYVLGFPRMSIKSKYDNHLEDKQRLGGTVDFSSG
ncbi:hypothetical protein PsorP6_001417 [Peronosclerospora sorghi]|uniref:Uncharacterized protein n=1 Tax=Peronosclerospora sorghi TaxID=230839 RepID=A0ACC0WVA9_9STRA|nr:hypothetical protein PsorP6_001417 [Peronosclerospora sorghi]